MLGSRGKLQLNYTPLSCCQVLNVITIWCIVQSYVCTICMMILLCPQWLSIKKCLSFLRPVGKGFNSLCSIYALCFRTQQFHDHKGKQCIFLSNSCHLAKKPAMCLLPNSKKSFLFYVEQFLHKKEKHINIFVCFYAWPLGSLWSILSIAIQHFFE